MIDNFDILCVFFYIYLDFVEFLIAVSMTSTKDPVRKTELFFSMYDIDRNGLIDENEMRCVVEVCCRYTYRCFYLRRSVQNGYSLFYTS